MKNKKIIYNRINIQPSQLPLYSIKTAIDNVNNQGLDISPEYQRDLIWSQEYKEQLILSLVLQYPIGNIVINQLGEPNEKNAIQELVDGKQRLSTIYSFMTDEFAVKGKNAKIIIETITNIMNHRTDDTKLLKLQNRKSFKFKDLPDAIQNNINAYNIAIYTMNSAENKQIREYFKVLQNQDRLRAGEIINSMPDNDLYEYFTEVNEGFLSKINYAHLRRADFEKIYYSICAVILDKGSLNAQDSMIIKFIESLDKDDLTETDIYNLNTLNNNMKYILNNDDDYIKETMSKRTLKLLLCMCAFNVDFFRENTTSKVNFLTNLSSKLSAFNTSLSDDDAYTKYFAEEYTLNREEFLETKARDYRKIYQVFEKTTKKTDVISNLALIGNYID